VTQKTDSYREHIEAKRHERDERYAEQRAVQAAIRNGLTECAESLSDQMPGMPPVDTNKLAGYVPTDLSLAETAVLGVYLATTAENQIAAMAADAESD
jgi:hypothetical protein